MNVPEIDHDLLVRLRHEGAKRVCESLDVAAIVGTQYDNVHYLADSERFFVYGWEPNSIAVFSREGAVESFDPNMYVAPGMHWGDSERLKQDYGKDHFTIFNANLISEWYADWLVPALERVGVTGGRVGIDRVSWIILETFKSSTPDIEWVNAEEALLLERAVKNEEERKLMRYANWVATEGIKAGLDAVAPGATEYELQSAAMGRLHGLGSEGDGFYPFLSSGLVKEATLHPSNRALEEGDPVIIDLGPVLGGYNGDCMRTGFVGEPTPEFEELYKVNHESLQAGIAATQPGVHISEVDAAVRGVARSRGYWETRNDSGHGIGLNCCELPVCTKAGVVSAHLDLVLEPGMCFSLEPRYFKMLDSGGFLQTGLEDIIMVSDTGAEVLTPAPFLDIVDGAS